MKLTGGERRRTQSRRSSPLLRNAHYGNTSASKELVRGTREAAVAQYWQST